MTAEQIRTTEQLQELACQYPFSFDQIKRLHDALPESFRTTDKIKEVIDIVKDNPVYLDALTTFLEARSIFYENITAAIKKSFEDFKKLHNQ